jgi:hypothetical protein
MRKTNDAVDAAGYTTDNMSRQDRERVMVSDDSMERS